MTRPKAWSVKGIDDETRDLARDAAQAAGLPIGSWIDGAILKAARGELPGITPPPAAGTTDDAGSSAATPAAPISAAGVKPPEPPHPGPNIRVLDATPDRGPAGDPGAAQARAERPAEDASAPRSPVVEPADRPLGDVAGEDADDGEAGPDAEPDGPAARRAPRPGFVRYLTAATVLLAILAGGVWIFAELSAPDRGVAPERIAREAPPDGAPPADSPAEETPPGLSRGSPALGTAGLPENVRVGIEMAKAGDAKAQHDLGMLYLTGRYVPKDAAEAAAWFEKAAVQGLVNAQFNLGVLYQTGEGVPQNPELAFFWFQSAAEQGDPRAQHNLATAYAEGRGVARSDELAIQWFARAAEAGLAQSQYSLGRLYEMGSDTRLPDLQAARSWYAKAAAQGDRPSAERLRELTAVMPSPPSETAPAPARIGRAEIREIQQLLQRMNFDPGPADGQMGSRTADAIRLYQRFAGLEVDGEATPVLLEDLRAVAATMSGAR